jgi:hypothetical protein
MSVPSDIRKRLEYLGPHVTLPFDPVGHPATVHLIRGKSTCRDLAANSVVCHIPSLISDGSIFSGGFGGQKEEVETSVWLLLTRKMSELVGERLGFRWTSQEARNEMTPARRQRCVGFRDVRSVAILACFKMEMLNTTHSIAKCPDRVMPSQVPPATISRPDRTCPVPEGLCSTEPKS